MKLLWRNWIEDIFVLSVGIVMLVSALRRQPKKWGDTISGIGIILGAGYVLASNLAVWRTAKDFPWPTLAILLAAIGLVLWGMVVSDIERAREELFRTGGTSLPTKTVIRRASAIALVSLFVFAGCLAASVGAGDQSWVSLAVFSGAVALWAGFRWLVLQTRLRIARDWKTRVTTLGKQAANDGD